MSGTARRNALLNVVGLAIIVGTAAYLLLPLLLEVRSVDVDVEPRVLAPDGRSEAWIAVHFLNGLGMELEDVDRSVHFSIVEGQASATIESAAEGRALLRAGFEPGIVRVKIAIEGFALPHEVSLRVEPRLT